MTAVVVDLKLKRRILGKNRESTIQSFILRQRPLPMILTRSKSLLNEFELSHYGLDTVLRRTTNPIGHDLAKAVQPDAHRCCMLYCLRSA